MKPAEPLAFPKPTRPIELVAADMDGTLLTDDFVLSPATREAVRRLLERGIDFILVSGRMVATLRPFHAELGLKSPVISYNGALIRDILTGRTIRHTPIDPEIAQEIIEFADAERLHLQYFWDDKFYAIERNPWMELYEGRIRLKGIVIDDLRVFGPDRPPTKMQFITEPARVQELVPLLRERYGDALYVTNTLPEYVEMMHPGVSKGGALRELGGILGVPTEHMLVFGDAQNDETMFDVAGLSIAMANARESVRKKADLVTLANTEDGVARALEALGLIEGD